MNKGRRGKGVSFIRKQYLFRFCFRLLVLAGVTALYLQGPQGFAVVEKGGFFSGFSPLHLLWLIWMGDMLAQAAPSRGVVPLGSQKLFCRHFDPAPRPWPEGLKEFIRKANRGAAKVFAVWGLLVALIGLLAAKGVFGPAELVLTCAFFYLCDLFCVLFFCPFKVFLMKNRCCTTCRIFNWDHLMMLSPLVFTPGFYGRSLAACALAVFLLWEGAFYFHPERFWEGSNRALKCAACTDRLCDRCGAPAPRAEKKTLAGHPTFRS